MLDLNSILVFSENPDDLAEYYKKVFQKEPDWSEGHYSAFKIGSGFITIGPHDKVHGKSHNPERIIFNFETDDVRGEFERIKALGTEVIKNPYAPDEAPDAWIATLADPDGNYFQLVSPMKM